MKEKNRFVIETFNCEYDIGIIIRLHDIVGKCILDEWHSKDSIHMANYRRDMETLGLDSNTAEYLPEVVKKMNDRQLGRFSIPEEMLRENTDDVAQIFGMLKIIPVRAESMFHECNVRYVAICEQFDDVPFGRVIPDYVIEVEKDNKNNVVSAKAIKKEN